MKIQLQKDRLQRGVTYHLSENLGIDPVIDDDAALLEWVQYVIADMAGHASDDGDLDLTLTTEGDAVLIDTTPAVLDAVRTELL